MGIFTLDEDLHPTPWPPVSPLLDQIRVWGMYLHSAGDFWAGTDSGAVRVRNGIVQRFRTAQGLPSDGVKAICEDLSGAVWIGDFRRRHSLAQ